MPIIKNKSELAVSGGRKIVLDLLEAGTKAVMPEKLMDVVRYNETFNTVTVQNRPFDLLTGRIFVIGGGKAVGGMAEVLERIIGPKFVQAGFVNSIKKKYNTEKIIINGAGLPLPDKHGVKGVKKMLELRDKYGIKEKDLVVCLLSGGGSALLPGPVREISLADSQTVTDLLINCGADIREINTVRKHLSAVKGGWLGEYFAPATVVSIIISDVIGDKLDVIASGPTVPDTTTFVAALDVLARYGLEEKVPPGVLAYIHGGISGSRPETPKELDNCHNFVIGSNKDALEAVALKAKDMGLKPIIAAADVAGDPESAAINHAEAVRVGVYKNYDLIIFGGETTPALPAGHGRGGRNQHYLACVLAELAAWDGKWTAASMTTDGSDSGEDAAGAIADNASLESGKETEVGSYIKNYDTYSFFSNTGSSIIKTGYTGTNVCDLIIYYLPKK